MSEEEMQRQMEFIVNQQAQFVTDIQKLQEAQGKLTDAVLGVVGIVGKLAETQERMTQEYAEFRKQTEISFTDLATKQAETDERLNIFINVVERYISERRNGKSDRDATDDTSPAA